MNRRHRAFSLLELVAVVAILGVLLAVLVPGLATVRAGVARARTLAMFHQWSLACAEFRLEYGLAPQWAAEPRLTTVEHTAAFLRCLTGREPDGRAVADVAALGGNRRRLAFLLVGPGDLHEGRLADAFGNTEIGVLLDRDGDGWIRPGADGALVGVMSRDGTGPFVPEAADLPAEGVRAAAIFYSAGRGRDASDLILSWR